ncbi:radical SAM protein [Candidatus Dependentiae bacterium]|nr:radical SAM protein [Candidatus Dependentiae bacterium]
MRKIIKGINFFRNYFINHYAVKFGLYLPKPVQVYWNITDSCNFKCVMCSRWSKKINREEEVSVELIKNVIDDLAEWGVYKFGITGGEPFTRKKNVFDAASYASSKGLWTHIGTNAFLLEDSDLEKLQKIGIGHLSVSIDGTEKIHDAIRCQNGSFKKILNVLKWADKFKIQIKINTVLTAKNLDSIFETVELALTYKFPVFIQPYNPYDSNLLTGHTQKSISEINDNWITENQNTILDDMLYKIIAMKKKYPQFILNDAEHLKNMCSYFKNPVSVYSKCETGYKNLQITPYGDIIACWNFNKSIGNIKTDKIQNIWYSEKFNKTRKIMDECKILCISGCRFYPSPLKLLNPNNIKIFLNRGKK